MSEKERATPDTPKFVCRGCGDYTAVDEDCGHGYCGECSVDAGKCQMCNEHLAATEEVEGTMRRFMCDHETAEEVVSWTESDRCVEEDLT